MKKVQIESISAGAVFTRDVFIDDTNLLVPAGVAVKQKDLDQLRKWGITHVSTDGEVAEGGAIPPPHKGVGRRPGLPERDSQEAVDPEALLKPSAVSEERELYRLYMGMIESLETFLSRLGAHDEAARKDFELAVQSVLQAVRDNQRDIVGFILGGDVHGYGLAKSSVNTAILSVMVGSQMKLPGHRLLQLAMGALLHDCGMYRIPKAILEKTGDLAEDELQKMRTHPLLSYKIMSKELGFPEDVARIGLQHHERWDGEGYPRKARGEDIDLLARIVSVADAFEAMVSEKPYRNSMIGYAAMKNLLSDNSRRFDPEVLKAFIRSMGIYPIGSIVLLNTSAIARVSEVHPDAPLRPKIRVIIDEYGRQYGNDEGDLIDLVAEKTLFIARAIDPKDFQEV